MLKEQLLKEYKIQSDKTFYTGTIIYAFCLCVIIASVVIYFIFASYLAATEDFRLLYLIDIDTEQVYTGTMVKAYEFLFRAFLNFIVCIVMSIGLCSALYKRRKYKHILSLINQIPDEI